MDTKENRQVYQREWERNYYNLNKSRLRKDKLKYFYRNRKKILEGQRTKRAKLRSEALLIYGGDPPKCACCGETHVQFLTLDHINGGGTKQRKILGASLYFYTWLKRNNYPKDYQVLCMNCNFSKGKYGYCPHKENIE